MSKDLASMFELPKEHYAELFGRIELHCYIVYITNTILFSSRTSEKKFNVFVCFRSPSVHFSVSVFLFFLLTFRKNNGCFLVYFLTLPSLLAIQYKR